jgi:glycosyltransferase involved in cell wall biosynthesis
MIVKNEAEVIERCLASVKDHIDYWVIVDTGSTDGTQEIIRKFLQEIPGQLYERPWKNFEHNRNEALMLAKRKADYLLFIDADEVLSFNGANGFPPLTADCYLAKVKRDFCEVEKCLLAKTTIPWHWEGVVHETLAYPGPLNQGFLAEVMYLSPKGGARSKNREATLKKDANMLEEALKENPTNSRNQFYLGLTYFCLNDFDKAYEAYQRRCEMKGSLDELFWSAYSCGKIEMDRGHSPVDWLLKAHRIKPERVEPLYKLVDYFLSQKLFSLGYMVAKSAVSMPLPANDRFFIESWIYDWGMRVKLAECLIHLGKKEEALVLLEKILEKDLPQEVRALQRRNYFLVLGSK